MVKPLLYSIGGWNIQILHYYVITTLPWMFHDFRV
jgi:hypothetical protein